MRIRQLLAPAAALGLLGSLYAANPVYVGAQYGLYRSTDAGVNWSQVVIPLNNPLLGGNVTPLEIKMVPGDPSHLYILGQARAKAVFSTTDSGATWTATPFVGINGTHIAVDVAGQVIYTTAISAATSNNQVLYKSSDNGASWTRLTVPSTSQFNPPPFGSRISMVEGDPKVSGTVYALSDAQEFFKSTDFGATWTLVSESGIHLTGGSVVPQTSILSLHVDPRNPKTWIDGADHAGPASSCPLNNGGVCGLFKSTDGGATFTGLSFPSTYVSSVSFGAEENVVWATGEVSGLGETLMRSTDAGATWTPIKNGLFSAREGRVWADPANGSILYVNDASSSHDFYVSTDSGTNFVKRAIPQGPPGCQPGACQQQQIYDVVVASPGPPVIVSVGNGADLQPGFSPGSWVTIKGSGLAASTGDWSNAIVGGKLPTSLNGTSVLMGGKPAYIYYTSPGQLNVIAPDVAPGAQQVTVTTAVGTSAPFTATSLVAQPAFFMWPDNQVVATRQDFSFAVKAGTFAGVNTVAAKPNDVIILWATGFGPTTPAAPSGVGVPSDQAYSVPGVAITLNNTSVPVFGTALAAGSVGLYQIAIQVPAGLADADYTLKATINGTTTATPVTLAVRK